MKWAENRPVRRLVFRPVDGWASPVRDRLPELDDSRWPTDMEGRPKDPWQEVYQIVLKNTQPAGDDDGLLTWVVSGYYQGKAIKKFIQLAIRETRKKPSGLMPVVLLGSVDQRSSYGDVATPMLAVVDWQPFGADASPAGDPSLVPEFVAAVAALSDRPELIPPAGSSKMINVTPLKAALPAKKAERDDPDDEIPF